MTASNILHKPRFDAAELKRRSDCRHVAEDLLPGVPHKSHGKYDTYPASIIGHDERTPSFQVYADGFRNYGVGAEGGSVIDFVMLVRRCELKEALDYLNDRVGGVSTLINNWQPPNLCLVPHVVKFELPSPEWQAVATELVERAERCLWSEHPECNLVLDYLRTVRGLSDETIRALRFGYIPNGRYTDWTKPNGQKAWINTGITIPHFDSDGAIFKLNVRTRVGNLAEFLGIPEDTYKGEVLTKYLQLAGGKTGLYIAGAFNPELPIVVFEGEFDAALAYQQSQGKYNCVTVGSATNRPTVDRFQPSQPVYLALDTDNAGQGGKNRWIEALQGHPVYTLDIQGKDFTEFVTLHHGTLDALLATAQKVVTHELQPYPIHLPDSIEKAIFEFWPEQRQIKAVATLARAIFEFVGSEPFTLTDLAARSGIDYKKLWRAMTTYGFSALCVPNSRLSNVYTYNIEDQDQESIGQSGICLSGADKTAIYQLPKTYVEFCQQLLKQIIIPSLEKQYGVKLAHEELLNLVDIDDPVEITKRINEKLIPLMDETEQQAFYGYRLAQKRWEKRLKDTTHTPLPETPDGKDWRKDYFGCVVARNAIDHMDDQQTLAAAERETGLNRRTITRIEQSRGTNKRVEVYHPTGRNIDNINDLPDTTYDPTYQGAPVRVITTQGVIADYRTERGQALASEAIEREGVVRIDYQQASRIAPMTPEERQALTDEKAREQAEKQLNQKQVKSDPDSGFVDQRKYNDLNRKKVEKAETSPVGWTFEDLQRFVEHAEKKFELMPAPGLEMKNRVLRLIGMYEPQEDLRVDRVSKMVSDAIKAAENAHIEKQVASKQIELPRPATLLLARISLASSKKHQIDYMAIHEMAQKLDSDEQDAFDNALSEITTASGKSVFEVYLDMIARHELEYAA